MNYCSDLVMMTMLYNIIIAVIVVLLLTNKQPLCVNETVLSQSQMYVVCLGLHVL